ncbi:MAG TPA: FimV/HubP family polar landmark protein [Gallionellaceae bacterium]
MGGNVRKSYLKTLAFAAGFSWASFAGAVGFGDATVNSALGQPLKIEIVLTSVKDSDRSGMTAHLASPDAFKAAGLEYPYHLTRLKFDVVTRGGKTVIAVTSKEPINDSFLNLLVELTWSSGRLVREYTLLLDPPDYRPEQTKPEPVTPIEPVVAVPSVEAPPVAASAPEAAVPEAAPAAAPVPGTEGTEAVVAAPAPASAPEAAPAPGIVQEVEATPASAVPQAQPETLAPGQAPAVEAQPAPAMQPPPAQEKAPARETITVKRGDTLSKIAAQIKEPDVTTEQMLVALYRANVKQFGGRNMNRIRAGKILTIPEPQDYEHLSQAAAVKEIRIQTANWQAYRQKLAAAGGTPVEEAPKQATGGKISVAEQAPQAKQPANGKLVLSQGAAPGDQTVAGGKQARENAAKEEAIAKEKQAKETEQRIAAQEKINQDAKKALELKGGAPVPASAPSSGVAPAKPRMPIGAASSVPAAEPSILDEILENPMLQDPVYLGGGGAALLAVLGGGYYLARRRNAGGGRTSFKKKR